LQHKNPTKILQKTSVALTNICVNTFVNCSNGIVVGTNVGPNITDYDAASGMVTFTEWLQLTLTSGVNEMTLGDNPTTLSADLTGDSAGGHSTAAPFNCTVPDSTQMNFMKVIQNQLKMIFEVSIVLSFQNPNDLLNKILEFWF